LPVCWRSLFPCRRPCPPSAPAPIWRMVRSGSSTTPPIRAISAIRPLIAIRLVMAKAPFATRPATRAHSTSAVWRSKIVPRPRGISQVREANAIRQPPCAQPRMPNVTVGEAELADYSARWPKTGSSCNPGNATWIARRITTSSSTRGQRTLSVFHAHKWERRRGMEVAASFHLGVVGGLSPGEEGS